jgi:hypothetical protein
MIGHSTLLKIVQLVELPETQVVYRAAPAEKITTEKDNLPFCILAPNSLNFATNRKSPRNILCQRFFLQRDAHTYIL